MALTVWIAVKQGQERWLLHPEVVDQTSSLLGQGQQLPSAYCTCPKFVVGDRTERAEIDSNIFKFEKLPTRRAFAMMHDSDIQNACVVLPVQRYFLCDLLEETVALICMQ